MTKQFSDFTLQAHFSVQVGERAVLLGKSGSGKTTLLRIIAGLEHLEGGKEGRISLGNQEITALPPRARDVGFVFQDQALFLGLSVLENITFGLKMRGVPRVERQDLAEVWLKRLGLSSRAHFLVGKLSGGERQRVAFARALIWKPRLILLDEPFSALDTELRDVLRQELVGLHQAWPAPLLMVTHDEADIRLVATSRLILLEDPASGIRTISRQSITPKVSDSSDR